MVQDVKVLGDQPMNEARFGPQVLIAKYPMLRQDKTMSVANLINILWS